MEEIKDAMVLDSNMVISPIGDTPYCWLDPIECDEIEILGFNWIDKDKKYRRMPVCEEGGLPPAVDQLAESCVGGQLRFITDSANLAIDAEFVNPHTMDHMTPVGQLGFDCYIGECGDMQYAATSRFDAKTNAYTVSLFTDIGRTERLITINFPLYNGTLKRLRVGLDPDATLVLAARPKKKVVVYGTSITQGGCASRPGMCYTNILSRMIDAEFINLGFSGSGKGEPSVMETIGSINDMDLLVIDYEANINDDIYDNLPQAFEIVRKMQPELSILILSRIGYGQENIRPENKELAIKRRDFQRDFVTEKKLAGDRNVEFFDGRILLGEGDAGEYAVDGCHLTDAGFIKMAEGLCATINAYVITR